MKSDVKLYHIIILIVVRKTKTHGQEWGDNIMFIEANNKIKFYSLKRVLKSIST